MWFDRRVRLMTGGGCLLFNSLHLVPSAATCPIRQATKLQDVGDRRLQLTAAEWFGMGFVQFDYELAIGRKVVYGEQMIGYVRVVGQRRVLSRFDSTKIQWRGALEEIGSASGYRSVSGGL